MSTRCRLLINQLSLSAENRPKALDFDFKI